MRVLPQQIRQQLVSVLRAWGMSDAHADTTAEMMLETDLRGVDSHGISMLPTYDREFRSGRLNMRPRVQDRSRGPGHGADRRRRLARPSGLGARDEPRRRQVPRDRRGRGVRVQLAPLRRGRLLLADRGRSRRDRHGHRVHPRRDAWCRRSPPSPSWAPIRSRSRRRPGAIAPFELDMATTTVAAGKVKVYKLNHRPLPPGWVVDGGGQPVTDAGGGVPLRLRAAGGRHHAARRRARRWAATRATASR